MTLTEFLLARIAEDEEIAQAAIQPDELYPWSDRSLPLRKPEDFPEDVRGYLGGSWGEHCARQSPLRTLAECKAKQDIVNLYLALDPRKGGREDALWVGLGEAVAMLAHVYADHVDSVLAWSDFQEAEEP